MLCKSPPPHISEGSLGKTTDPVEKHYTTV